MLVGLFCMVDAAAAGGPWRQVPAFGVDGDQLLAAAAALPAPDDAPVRVLFQDTSYRFEADGRLTQTRHWIYQLLAAEALADWSTSQVRWSRWHQLRPQLRARVITAAGEEHWLDAGVARDRKAPEGGEGLYGDRWLTEATLPAMSVGAIVEEEIVLREALPVFTGGTSHRHYTALLAPTHEGRLTLDASTRLALRFGSRLMPGVEPTTEVENGRVRVVFEFADLAAIEAPEDGAPGHRPRFPQVAFSTGRSWQRVAGALAARVDQAVAAASLDVLGDSVRRAGTLDRQERLWSILDAVRRQVRWNGLEIGAGPLDLDVDRALGRGSGDSLVLAVTTVAALRRVGISARVALVKTGFSVDVEPRLPGFGLFDHALVWLEDAADETRRWLEPAAPHTRVGELTLPVQGRFALVAGPASEDLVLTPASEPIDNLAVEVREIHFADFGPGRLAEACTYHGSAERTQRRITGSLDAAARRRGYQAYANAFHLASGLGELRETAPDDLSGPFELYLEALDSSRVRTDLERAVVEIPVREMARRLPPVLLDDPRPRSEEFIFPEPFISRWRYRVEPPQGFELEALPESRKIQLGPATFEESWRIEQGVVTGDLSFDVGQRLLAPSQFEALSAAVGSFLEQPPSEVRFRLAAAEHLDHGRYREALGALRAAADSELGRASQRVRWALGLLHAGLGIEARRQAQQAVALAPRWGLAHWAFGWVLMHDEVGTFFATGSELDEARQALDEAQRLAPDEPLVSAALARMLERDEHGSRYGDGAELDLAAAAYRRAAALQDPSLHLDRLRLLVVAGRWQELREAATRAGDLGRMASAGGLAGRWMAGVPPWLSSGSGLGDVFGTLASAMLEGMPAAAALAPAHRRAAAQELAAGRRYVPAVQLLLGLEDPLAERLAAVRPFEQLDRHPQDPQTPLAALLIALRRRPAAPEETAKWLHENLRREAREALLQRLGSLLPEQLEGVSLPPAVRADLALADLRLVINGAPHLGYRLSLGEWRCFVTLQGERLQLVADSDQPQTLGAEALRRLLAGDLPGGQQWLIWAHEELAEDLQPARDPLAFSAFMKLWPATLPKEGLVPSPQLRLAAAALAAAEDSGGEALEILQQAEAGDSRQEDGGRRLAIEVALLDAYAGVGDYLGLDSHAGALVERFPTSHRAFVRKLEAMASLEQWQDLEEAARERVAAAFPDPDARRVLAGLAVDRGAPEAAADQLRAIDEEGELGVADAANLLLLLLRGPEPAVREAEQLLERTAALGENDPRWWRAMAAWRAHAGEVREAREALARAVRDGGGRLQLADAYVVGRLAELCGLPETARDLYRRLAGESDAQRRAPLMRLLAQDRLRQLDAS